MNAATLRHLGWQLRAAAPLVIRRLGPAGWVGVAALLMAIACAALALQREAELQTRADALAERIAQADAARRMRAAAPRVVAPAQPTRTAGTAIAGPSGEAPASDEPTVLRLPPASRQAGVLPVPLVRRAARLGLTLGPVEYRWAARGDVAQRIDVQLSGSGSYPAVRAWLSELLVAMPHAQLVELSTERSGVDAAPLSVRIVVAMHLDGGSRR